MGGICPKKSKVAVAPENGSAENSKTDKTQDNTNGNILTICTFFY